eukprot:gene8261-9144_t
MAFKLVDDKGSDYNKINEKNRVAKLFEELLPSNEYIVNRSGKYCCRVCPKWPVFDTLSMLKLHRDAAKHKSNYDNWEKQKLMKCLFEQNEDVSNESNDILPETSSSKRRNMDGCGCEEFPLLKRVKTASNDEEIRRKDFIKHECTCLKRSSKVAHEKHRSGPFFQPRLKPFQKDNCPLHSPSNNKECVAKTSNSKQHFTPNDVYKFNVLQSKSTDVTKCTTKTTKNESTVHPPEINKMDQKVKLANYYVRMKQAGWILNSDAKWVKDENCEFDSDEDPPDFEQN